MHLITAVEEAEIIPGIINDNNKRPNTRIKPLPLVNGRYIAVIVTSERAFVSVGEWPLHIE